MSSYHSNAVTVSPTPTSTYLCSGLRCAHAPSLLGRLPPQVFVLVDVPPHPTSSPPCPIRYSDAVTVSCVAYQQRYLRLSSLLVDRSASAYLQGAQSRQRTREPNGLTICTKTNKNITPLPACEQCRVCNKCDYTKFLTI